MRVLRIGFLVAVLSAISIVAASAQSINPGLALFRGGWGLFNVNLIVDSGFEATTFSPWNEAGSYIDTTDGDTLYEGFGYISTSHHSGSHAYDFNVGEGSYGAFFNSEINQTLSSPIAGSAINTGSVWVLAEDQTLGLAILYSDNTLTYTSFSANASHAPAGSGGWQLWNFTSAINPNKTVVGLQFTASSGFGSDILIDDVNLDVWEWVWI